MTDQIIEVPLRCAVHCGVPAANTGFHFAKEVLKEIEARQAER